MINPEITGKFIAQCRKEKQMTQKQLGEQLGVTDRAVSKWETGKSFPDIALLENLCSILDISISELIAGKKIAAEQYHEETERLLAESVSNSQLYGYQIVIYTLEFAAITLFGISLRINVSNLGLIRGMCWLISAALIGCIYFLDKVVPRRNFRTSNTIIEGVSCGIYLILTMGWTIIFADPVGALKSGAAQADDIITVCLTSVFCAAAIIAFRVRRAAKLRKSEKV